MLIELRVIRVFNWVPRVGVVTVIDVTNSGSNIRILYDTINSCMYAWIYSYP